MKTTLHTARQFADAIAALLPPGAAWRWAEGGLGDQMLLGTGQELARVDASAQDVLDDAVAMHKPGATSWHISAYLAVAKAAAGTGEVLPRKPAAIGGHVGNRFWSHDAASTTFEVPLVQVEHLLGPAAIGRRIGDAMWIAQARYIVRVRYYRSVVPFEALRKALAAFKQAHVFLWFEDVTGVGGFYAQN